MTNEFEDEAKIVAYHEAGHAVIAIACGFRVTSLSVNESEVGKGFVGYQIPEAVDAVIAKKATLVFAAGLAADFLLAGKTGKLRPNDEFLGHFNDQGMANDYIRQTGQAGSFDDYLAFAMWFLKQNWGVVEQVATALFYLKTFNPDSLDTSKFPELPDNWTSILDKLIFDETAAD
jgi:hypothetical protein